jgi:hypothetical protein
MTVSASEPAAASDRLERSLELYRDLSVALFGRITQLKAGTEGGGGDAKACKDADDDLKSHKRVLLNVLDAEASLEKRSRSGDGAGVQLDLDAARAEIVERLGAWAAEG